jgi:hypothetical protein
MPGFRHQHTTALAHPCLLAEETAHPRFRRVIAGVGSVIITINSGYE